MYAINRHDSDVVFIAIMSIDQIIDQSSLLTIKIYTYFNTVWAVMGDYCIIKRTYIHNSLFHVIYIKLL